MPDPASATNPQFIECSPSSTKNHPYDGFTVLIVHGELEQHRLLWRGRTEIDPEREEEEGPVADRKAAAVKCARLDV